MRTGILFSLLVALGGCADTHQTIRAGNSTVAPSKQETAYVGVPADGSYTGGMSYPGSGGLTAQLVAAAFSPYLARVTVAAKREDFDAALKATQSGGHQYLLYPEILLWEDRATEWSGRPDQVSVKVSVVRADTGAILDSVVVSGKSGILTFGGDRPEHLLPKPLADYAATVFRK